MPALTILCHPDARRVGEVATLPSLLSGGSEVLSRHDPLFGQPEGGAQRPLADTQLSRMPITLGGRGAGAVTLDRGSSPTAVTVDGPKAMRRFRKRLPALARGDLGRLERSLTAWRGVMTS